MNLKLHIDRIVFDGFSLPHSQRPIVQAAIEAELTRLFTADGLPPNVFAGGAIPHLAAAPIQLAPNSNPTQIGQQIAQSVYGGIGQ